MRLSAPPRPSRRPAPSRPAARRAARRTESPCRPSRRIRRDRLSPLRQPASAAASCSAHSSMACKRYRVTAGGTLACRTAASASLPPICPRAYKAASATAAFGSLAKGATTATAPRSRRDPMVCSTPALDSPGTLPSASRKTSSTLAPGMLCSASGRPYPTLCRRAIRRAWPPIFRSRPDAVAGRPSPWRRWSLRRIGGSSAACPRWPAIGRPWRHGFRPRSPSRPCAAGRSCSRGLRRTGPPPAGQSRRRPTPE